MILTDVKQEFDVLKIKKKYSLKDIARMAGTYPATICHTLDNNNKLTENAVKIFEILGYDIKLTFVKRPELVAGESLINRNIDDDAINEYDDMFL